MDRDTVARIEDWETQPYSGGHAGLRDLAQAEFSGAISTAGAWVFMLNGRIIRISSGSLATLADADGTAYVAPHPSLPLLFAMQDRQGEVQAKYYTDDTPLQEVDETLRDANFTGYIVLSENVLSGDYYVVYYGGRSLSVAFIGNAERMISGDEAFEKAADEVGIYEVREVDLDVQEVPPPDETSEPTQSSAVASTGTPEDQPASQTPDTETSESEPTDSTDTAQPEAATQADAEPDPDPATESGPAQDPVKQDTVEADSSPPPDDQPASDSPPPDTQPSPSSPPPDGSPDHQQPATSPADGSQESNPDTPPNPDQSGTEPTPGSGGAQEPPQDEDPFSEEQEWRQARTIPALDPEETATRANESAADTNQNPTGQSDTPPRSTQESATDPRNSNPQAQQTTSSAHTTATPDQDELRARIDDLEEELNARIAKQEELTETLETLRAERDELKAERDQLQRSLNELDTDQGSAAVQSTSGPNLEPADAFARTDLLVRYRSKGDATLQDAIDGTATKDDVTENLRLDYHTRFAADTATVDGQPFAEFLTVSVEYGFVNWFVSELVFELRETGNQKALSELYATIPEIDRIEFQGAITVEDETGDEVSRTFDLVMRDRMGQALVVANINDDRDPATDAMMEDLIDGAATIGEHLDSLGAAFLVTSSFFEPGALEMATNASGGGFLNRGSKKSFVRLSRKQGYHLCLVEARDETFHIAVPEL